MPKKIIRTKMEVLNLEDTVKSIVKAGGITFFFVISAIVVLKLVQAAIALL